MRFITVLEMKLPAAELRGASLSKGMIVYSSTPEMLWGDQEAKHLYLGV